MSQESNLRWLGLTHLIGDNEKLKTAIELYVDDVKAGRRSPPHNESGLFLARCDLELKRLQGKGDQCQSLGAYLRGLASKGITVEKITMCSPDPSKNETVIKDHPDSKETTGTSRPPRQDFKTENKNLQSELNTEQNCVDALTGVFNRFAYDNLNKLSTQIVIDISAMHRIARIHGRHMVDTIIACTAEEIEQVVRAQWGSREVYRIEDARFVIQTANDELHFDLIGRIKQRLDRVDIKIRHDGEMVHIPCISFRFGVGPSLESASEGLTGSEGH